MTPKERAAKAIFDDRHKGLLNCLNWDDLDLDRTGNRNFYLNAASASLAAVATPSEAMIEAIKSAWKTPHASISDNGAMVIWKAAHTAMMAEKDEAE